jgi:general secretion pathway protein J
MNGRQEAGFTILEVLAALSVLGLILLALSQGTQFGLAAWRSQSASSARHNELEAVDRTLRALIERTVSEDTMKNRGPLLGGIAGLDVVTVLPPRAGLPPDRTAEVRLEVDSLHRLVVRWRPMPHAIWIGKPQLPSEDVLLRGVERLEIGYWQMAPGGGGMWLRNWTAADPPSLVRIRIVFPPGDPRRWPDIVTGPRVDQALSFFRRYIITSGATIRRGRFNSGILSHAA